MGHDVLALLPQPYELPLIIVLLGVTVTRGTCQAISWRWLRCCSQLSIFHQYFPCLSLGVTLAEAETTAITLFFLMEGPTKYLNQNTSMQIQRNLVKEPAVGQDYELMYTILSRVKGKETVFNWPGRLRDSQSPG